MSIKQEFHLTVLGAAGVGKTSLMQRLSGKPFNRKAGHKPSIEEEAVQYSLEVATSDGLLLFHFYDWSYAEKRKNEDINRQLQRGSDGALFVYDVTEKRSKTDFYDFNDWYERAAGFDKPWIIISNKNEQKKHSVLEGEGQALANKGNQRCYVPLSLVDDTGIDEVMLAITRLMMKDLNLSISKVAVASEGSMQWSKDKALSGSAISSGSLKNHRILLLVLNSSVVEKFVLALDNSSYSVEQTGSVEGTEEVLADVNGDGLPVYALVGAPTMSDGQKTALKALAAKYSIPCVITVPRSILDELELKKK